ncbi:MAG: DoxX family protein [Vicinamibacteraceae bacterium]|nr:DoxX family protein [Vicinamibacteraceae bacterium]
MNANTFPRGPMVAITVLRVLVGWHFLYEGIAKLSAPAWSAADYLRQSRGPFSGAFRWLASQPDLLANADLITMWGLTAVGLLLILGLFTRWASIAGIGFILLFYLCNPPFVGYFYSIPSEGSYLVVNKNLVELAALLVIFTVNSGRFAGLDRILGALVARRPPLAGVPS